MNAQLDRLYEHLAWADSLVLDALEPAGEPSATVLRVLGHLFSAERIWLMRIRRLDTSQVAVWSDLSLAQCRTVAGESAAGFREVIRNATADQLAAPIPYRTSKGQALESSLQDILFHVALHGSYHRGQIAAQLRREGLEPVGTDFIVFTRPAAGAQGACPSGSA